MEKKLRPGSLLHARLRRRGTCLLLELTARKLGERWVGKKSKRDRSYLFAGASSKIVCTLERLEIGWSLPPPSRRISK